MQELPEIKLDGNIFFTPISDIKPNPENRNKHSQEQIDRLCDIIKYQGFRQPLVVSHNTGLLVAGHGRLLAAKQLGMKEVPVVFEDFDSPEQEYAFGISDNSIALWAELDLSSINSDVGDLGPDFNIDVLGIKSFTVEVADRNIEIKEKELYENLETHQECPSCGYKLVNK